MGGRTQLNVLHYSTVSQENHLLLHLLAHAEERRGTALESGPLPPHQWLQYAGLDKCGA